MVINKDNNIITIYEGKSFILMKMFIKDNDVIRLDDLHTFKKFNFNLNNNNNNWKELWSKKIDYFEYQIEELKKTNSLIYDVSDYFIGLTEIGIQLMNENLIKNNKISHKRVYTAMQKKDLYNPLNIVIDDESRDFAEYYKDVIFKGKKIAINDFIYQNDIKNIKLFFIRLLYITPFFDAVDNIIRFNKEENNINKILLNVEFYEEQLKTLYSTLYKNKIIQEINFFKKT